MIGGLDEGTERAQLRPGLSGGLPVCPEVSPPAFLSVVGWALPIEAGLPFGGGASVQGAHL